MVTGLKIKRESGAKAASSCLSTAKEFIPWRQCKAFSDIWIDTWSYYIAQLWIIHSRTRMRTEKTNKFSISVKHAQTTCWSLRKKLLGLPACWIRCHSVLSRPWLSSTHYKREHSGNQFWIHVSRGGKPRPGGLPERERLSKYNKDRLCLTFVGDLCSATSYNCFPPYSKRLNMPVGLKRGR